MTMMDAPVVPQHMEALARANASRLAGSQLKKEVAAGTLTVREALVDERAGSMTIVRLLMAHHRWGRTRSLQVLRSLPVSETKRVRDLTERQRNVIADLVERGESRPWRDYVPDEYREVLCALRDRPRPVTSRSVASDLGRTAAWVSRRMSTLARHGLVSSESGGGLFLWEITEMGREALNAAA